MIARRYGLFAALALSGAAHADGNYDFWISDQLLRDITKARSTVYSIDVDVVARSKVKKPADDCEMHIAATPVKKGLASPSAIVVEPPYLCKFKPATGGKWEALIDDVAVGKRCTATGFFRILDEHLTGQAAPTNPHHMLEIHPATGLRCGETDIRFTDHLVYHEDMKSLKPSSAKSCFSMGVRVRRNAAKGRIEFDMDRPVTCGNFMKYRMSVFSEWIREIGPDGGHSAIARVQTGTESRTLKLYTLPGTPEDKSMAQWRRQAGAGEGDDHHGVYFHGMTTVDHFAVWKALTDANGNWSSAPAWKEVEYPLALVVMGTVSGEAPGESYEEHE